MRGGFDRNVLLEYSGGYLTDKYYVRYERKHPVQGLISVCRNVGKGKYFIIWRNSRNSVRDFLVMYRNSGIEYSSLFVFDDLESAVRNIPTAIAQFQVPQIYRKISTIRRTGRIRDSQRSKVYRWERGSRISTPDVINTLSINDLREFSKSICSELGLDFKECPTIRSRSGCSSGYYLVDNIIKLIPEHHERLTLIHELSHFLVRYWVSRDKVVAAHGQEFVGIYCYLMIRFLNKDYYDLMDSLREARIAVTMPTQYYLWLNEYKKAA
jgi:hypothetical protein